VITWTYEFNVTPAMAIGPRRDYIRAMVSPVTAMKSRIRAVTVSAIGLLAVAISVVVAVGIRFETGKSQVPSLPTQADSRLLSYLGVYEPTSPGSYSGMEEFSRLIDYSPQIAVYYSSWWEPFQAAFAQAAHAHLAIPMVQIEPRSVNLAAIAAGQYDSFLTAYALSVRSFGQPVILSFGHEMNASWYSWGYRHTSPTVFVAAWRHIYNLFAAEGVDNVTWLWTVNVVGPGVTAIKAWWPGAAYVTWVGIDGHYFEPSARFAQLFGGTLGQVRQLTRDPILIAESGIAPDVGIAKITDLFAGAQAHGLLGVVWFDEKGNDLQIENDPAAIATFERAVRRYFKSAASGESAKKVVDYGEGLGR
jgi:Glycosyl hydrolase family 26